MKLIRSFTILLSLAPITSLQAQTSLLDTDFGVNGQVITSVGDGEDRGEVVTLQADGKIILAGVADYYKRNDFSAVRYKPDGHVDPDFGHNGRVVTDLGGNDHVFGVAVQRDRKIVLAGFTQKSDSHKADLAILRYNANGTLDTSFGTQGWTVTDGGGHDEIHFIDIQVDGKIVAAGFVQKGTDTDFVVVRYLSSGQLDPAFGKNGIVRTDVTRRDRFFGVTLQPDGKIVAVGSMNHHRYGDDCAVVRYHGNGELDKEFGYGGMASLSLSPKQDMCAAVALQPDLKIVVTGFAVKGEANSDFALARLLSDGTMDKNFGHGGPVFMDFMGHTDSAHAVVVDRSGRILVSGEYEKDPERSQPRHRIGFALARFLPNGASDKSFNGGSVLPDFGTEEAEISLSMALQNDGKILLAGMAKRNFALTRYFSSPPPASKKR